MHIRGNHGGDCKIVSRSRKLSLLLQPSFQFFLLFFTAPPALFIARSTELTFLALLSAKCRRIFLEAQATMFIKCVRVFLPVVKHIIKGTRELENWRGTLFRRIEWKSVVKSGRFTRQWKFFSNYEWQGRLRFVAPLKFWRGIRMRYSRSIYSGKSYWKTF